MKKIRKVAVLGSGVMGAAIAAHLANCGVPSIMLDIVTPNLSEEEKKDPKKRNALVEGNKANLLKAKPAPLYSKSYIDMIETGNFEDDMHKIADCDWIIEVVMENLDIKRQGFETGAQQRKPGSIVTSNTSGIPIRAMAETMPKEMSQHFMGTHFFNPPRYLRLLELIPGPDTLPEVVETMAWFGENVLGKGIVYAKDTPNFIANRILTFTMAWILHEMTKEGLTVEEIDALTGPAIGHASSATFRTADLVGLDTFVKVVKNVYDGCPNDECRDYFKLPEWVDKMVEKKLCGNKTGCGFYKKTDMKDEKGKPIIQAIDPNTLEYRDPVKPNFECIGAVKNIDDLAQKLKIMHFSEDKGSKFLFKLFANVAKYAGNRIPEISDDIVNIDNAVKWGFAWEAGIFETWDMLGFEEVCNRMEQEGIELPPIAKALKEVGGKSFYKTEDGVDYYFDLATKSYKPIPKNPKEIRLASIKKQEGKEIGSNDSASLVYLGDGIICCEFHCKMNAIDADIVTMLNKGVELLEEDKYDGMIIANQGPHFSAGANLMLILGQIMQNDWKAIEMMVKGLQTVNMRMKYCSKPVVAAPHHYTFGGGLEICLHAAKCVIAGETYSGLVEAGVGVIPAGGGTKEMLVRALEYLPEGLINPDPMPYIRRAFEDIATAKVATSGVELIELGYMRPTDIIEPNFELQVGRAKNVCLGLLQMGYRPPRPPKLWALGETIRAAFEAAVWGMKEAGFATEHDMLIANKVAYILTGGDRAEGTPITEQDVLDLECEAFCSLCGTEKTKERIQHMLMKGKPLRN